MGNQLEHARILIHSQPRKPLPEEVLSFPSVDDGNKLLYEEQNEMKSWKVTPSTMCPNSPDIQEDFKRATISTEDLCEILVLAYDSSQLEEIESFNQKETKGNEYTFE